MNVAIITLDSLRFDVSQEADLPNFNKLFALTKDRFHKVYSQATYTLPSHISLFRAGILPSTPDMSEGKVYNRKKGSFVRAGSRDYLQNPIFNVPASKNIVKGFEMLGYKTIGVGGVEWFNTDFPTSSFWKGQFFQEFHYDNTFNERNQESIENVTAFIKTLNLRQHDKLFFFLNIAATHYPYLTPDTGIAKKTKEDQKKALERVDKQILEIINELPKPVHILILADHGECFGEGGIWGHAQYHEKILEVPMYHAVIKEDIV